MGFTFRFDSFSENHFARFGETCYACFQTASSGIIFSVPFSLLAAYRLGQDFCRCT
ncbi:hypothetical protein NEIFL0001_1423 [Neisseria flavescens SK114]|nr:hypothetical protein NEIFL0001_1423 [Neisseria flavescens SK114]